VLIREDLPIQYEKYPTNIPANTFKVDVNINSNKSDLKSTKNGVTILNKIPIQIPNAIDKDKISF
jgi:hypothetical protein